VTLNDSHDPLWIGGEGGICWLSEQTKGSKGWYDVTQCLWAWREMPSHRVNTRWQDNYIARFLLHDRPARGNVCVCVCVLEKLIISAFPEVVCVCSSQSLRVCVTAFKDSIQLACDLRVSMHVYASLQQKVCEFVAESLLTRRMLLNAH